MKKKILFITYENPFVRNTGDSIYTCNVLDGLISLSNNIDIIYFDSNVKEPKISNSDGRKFCRTGFIKQEKKNSIQFVFSLLPGMIVNRKSQKYLDVVKKFINDKNYDSIFINHQKMMFVLPTILRSKKSLKLIYVSHNVEYLLSSNLTKNNPSVIKKIIYWQDAFKTKFYERKWISKFDIVTSISEHDADYFKQIYKISKVFILRPIFNNKDTTPIDLKNKKINKLIIAGSFEWEPKKDNLLLFLNAKNFHKLNDNGISLDIVGRANPKFVDFINNKYKGVYMTGEVESLSPYYQEAKIAIVPERLGGGFKLKIVEAAMNKAAIFSIKGAITKCNFIRNEHFIEKNTFEELISEIIKVQKISSSVDNMVQNAFFIAKNSYTKERMMDELKKVV